MQNRMEGLTLLELAAELVVFLRSENFNRAMRLQTTKKKSIRPGDNFLLQNRDLVACAPLRFPSQGPGMRNQFFEDGCKIFDVTLLPFDTSDLKGLF